MSFRLLVATRKGLFTLERQANNWRIINASFLGDHCPMVLHDSRDETIYAALDHGHFGSKLHRSRDQGQSWEEIAVPTYPEQTEEEVNPFSGKPLVWRLEKIWALEAGNADQPGHIWCGTLPGGLFRSTDQGNSWELIGSLWREPRRKQWFGGGMDQPGIHSICVDPRDGNHLTLGISCGGVWVTRNGGESWDCQADGMWAAYMPPEMKGEPNAQDPHSVVQCQSQPDCLWSQHHNGVFRSTDGAASWQEVDAAVSHFGFPVAVHPNDPETAWLAPAIKDEKRIPVDGKVVVTRTRDGGKSFDVLTKGLPQEHAYDIVFRHALVVDSTGETLAMGSTTGNLWISSDQGDSWNHITNHLPQIYCVKFI